MNNIEENLKETIKNAKQRIKDNPSNSKIKTNAKQLIGRCQCSLAEYKKTNAVLDSEKKAQR